MKRDRNGQFKRSRCWSRDELIFALLNYKPNKSITGKKNPNYVHGKGEQYCRITIRGKKLKRSHIVWMIGAKRNHVPEGKDIHHKNENKRDDRFCNLELADSREHGNGNLKWVANYECNYGGGRMVKRWRI